MNKILIFTLLLLTTIFIHPAVINATSGACSWHGGVDLLAGADYDGSVICNDGWTDSSVVSNSLSSSGSSGCRTNYEIEILEKYKAGIISIGINTGYTDNHQIEAVDGQISMCRQQIAEYQTSKNQTTIITDVPEKDKTQLCREQYGMLSFFDPLDQSCGCNEGFIFSDTIPKSCISIMQSCQNKYGPNSYGTKVSETKEAVTKICYCFNGYEFNSDQTQCIKSKPTVTEPIKEISTEQPKPDLENIFGSDFSYDQQKTPPLPTPALTTSNDLKPIKIKWYTTLFNFLFNI